MDNYFVSEQLKKISVAIIERNERLYIEQLIKSIINTIKNSHHLKTDITIIDGGSTDGTIELIKEKYVPRGINLLFDPGEGLGVAHNFAIKNLDCDIVFFTFGDELVSNSWISSALKWFEQQGVAAVFGPVYILAPKSLMERYADWKLRRYFLRLRRGQHVPYAAATNLAVRRDIALRVGGFREDLIDADDSEFTYRLSKTGYKVVFEPEMIVYHQKAEEARLGTMIRATMLVAFGYGQVAAIHGIKWHPICLIYASVIPFGIPWLATLFINTLVALGIFLSMIIGITSYFIYQSLRYRSWIPLLGIVVEPLRLVFAGLSFPLGYIYQKSLYRFPRIANIIKKVFDYIRLRVGH